MSDEVLNPGWRVRVLLESGVIYAKLRLGCGGVGGVCQRSRGEVLPRLGVHIPIERCIETSGHLLDHLAKLEPIQVLDGNVLLSNNCPHLLDSRALLLCEIVLGMNDMEASASLLGPV